jgi:Protein of unknown function (DUF433)
LWRYERITIDPAVATGKPCIRNLRFPVSRLLGLLAAGETRESILNPPTSTKPCAMQLTFPKTRRLN